MIERIIEKINNFPEITNWRIQQRTAMGYQIYVIGDWLDTVRKVSTDRFQITIYCEQDGRLGSTDIAVCAHEIHELEARLRKAVFVARRIRNPLYHLQGSLRRYPCVETFDPTLIDNLEELLFVKLADQVIESVGQHDGVRLSSAEFFVDATDIHYQNSNGIDVSWSETNIMFDGVLLSGDYGNEIELHFEPRARRVQDLPIPAIVGRNARFVLDSTRAVSPPSGRYPVLLTHDALNGVFAPIIQHSSAQYAYRNISMLIRGEPIGDIHGDRLTLISNGFIPFGLKTHPIDSDGLPACRCELIRDGIFERPWSSGQYAEYLGIEPTGSIANIEIPIGRRSLDNLRRADTPVLEVVAFSAMMPDTISGNFAAEIKLGYLHDKGITTPVRGGSVSGNLINGFEHAFFSTEATQTSYALVLDNFGSYIGPAGIRFERFQISGSG